MTRRYYHAELPANGGIVTLSDHEANHAIRVMRLQIDDEITLFDGRGNESQAAVENITRRECTVRCEPLAEVNRESSIRLTLGIALPKPDRARELIERLAEVGVVKVVPIVAERTQRPPSPSLLEKLRRGVIEACKQSRRNRLMQIDEPTNLSCFLEMTTDPLKLIAHPDGVPLGNWSDFPKSVSALVGPEGGWTDEEVAQAIDGGFQKIGLGKRIFRIETAAVVIAANLTD